MRKLAIAPEWSTLLKQLQFVVGWFRLPGDLCANRDEARHNRTRSNPQSIACADASIALPEAVAEDANQRAQAFERAEFDLR